MDITGKVQYVSQITTVGEKQTQARDFVVCYEEGEFPKSVCFNQFGDAKVSLIDSLKVGDDVKVNFNMNCNENKGRRYNRISAWKIEKLQNPMGKVSSDEDLPF